MCRCFLMTKKPTFYNLANEEQVNYYDSNCISKKRGTQKKPVDTARLRTDWGIEGDAHAGHWHRQVSLLSQEEIDANTEEAMDFFHSLKAYDELYGNSVSHE